MKLNKDDLNKANNFVKYTAIGMQMMAIIGLGIWGGIEADKALNTNPLFTILGAILAVGMAIYHAVKDFIKMDK
jgi:F0F1-type ATP synthase assembly protein I